MRALDIRKIAALSQCIADPSTLLAIITNMYADDLLNCKDSIEEAIRLIQQITELFNKCGFKLTKWSANDRPILECFSMDELAPNLRDLAESFYG